MSAQRLERALAREVPHGGELRALLIRSYEVAMHSPSAPGTITFNAAAMAGQYLVEYEVTSHALDRVMQLEKSYPHMRAAVAHLEQLAAQERGER